MSKFVHWPSAHSNNEFPSNGSAILLKLRKVGPLVLTQAIELRSAPDKPSDQLNEDGFISVFKGGL